MLKSVISILSVCCLIYLPLFLYTQIAVILERINTYGYTLADHEEILEGLPVFKLRIPFDLQIKESFKVRLLFTVGLLTCVIGLIIFICAGEFIGRRFKSGYDRKSYKHLLTKRQRKRGLCRIEYTAEKRSVRNAKRAKKSNIIPSANGIKLASSPFFFSLSVRRAAV